MLNNSLTLPEPLLKEAVKCAVNQGISVEQFIIWAIAEKIGVLTQPSIDLEYPHITYKRGASGKFTPIINNSGLRVQTLVIAHHNWNLSIHEIAQEYDLTEELVEEALAFYQTHQDEIAKAIASEQGLELTNV
jgi:uncharacterized protein (DUF433 family)